MRGGRRPRGGGGVGGGGRGGGGGGGAGFVSPNPPTTASTTRDHRSDGRPNPFPHHPRRSLSPPVHSRTRRSPGRRSSSVERREFASMRTDHGKQPLSEHHHSRNRRTPFEDEGYDFQHKYMFPDNSSDPILDVNPGSKLSRANKDIEFHHQGSGVPALSSSGLGGQGMMLRKSMFLDDGSAHTFFTLPPDTGYLSGAAALKSESIGSGLGNLNAGIHNNEMPHYRERLRDPNDKKDTEKVYHRDATFPMIPSSQTRPLNGNTSSSGLAKDNLLGLYHDRHHRPSDGFGRGGVNNFTDDPLERNTYSQVHLSDPVRHNTYSQVQLSDPVRRGPLVPPPRDGPRDYGYHDGRSERGDHGFLSDNDLYKKMLWDYQGNFRETLGSSFMNFAGDRGDRLDLSRKNLSESSFWDQHRSLRDDADLNYHDMKMVHEDYVGSSGSGRDGFRMKSSRDHELAPVEERFVLGRDPVPMTYRARPRSPLLSDRDVDIRRQGVSSPVRGTSRMDDFGVYNASSERLIRRKYVMDDDVTETDPRSMFSNVQNVFQRIRSPSGNDEIWSNEDRVEFLPSKKLAFGQQQHRMSARRLSRPDAWLQPDSSAYAEGDQGMSLKRRLKPCTSESHGSFYSEKSRDFFRPRKFWRRDLEDRHGDLNAHEGDALDNDDARLAKTDPPKDSEEFKNQVYKAFLRFSKLLNESMHQQRRYRDQGKSGNLLCCVCGSQSKEFVDTHNLVMHTYNSLKVGLRTEHLGLHKAVCVLMGWNWLMPPENSRGYQSTPVAEAKALKEDLILWPPLIIIHNSSIGNKKNTNGSKVLPIEGMEEILRDMGFGAGKIRVCRGRPANQSVFLVKFMPTFSGLREAERLHEHYAANKRGREGFQQIASERTSGGSSSDGKVGEAHGLKVEELLYGYMAIAEDLDKLDPETKKRSLVKSKKDIEAIADAPLNTD